MSLSNRKLLSIIGLKELDLSSMVDDFKRDQNLRYAFDNISTLT